MGERSDFAEHLQETTILIVAQADGLCHSGLILERGATGIVGDEEGVEERFGLESGGGEVARKRELQLGEFDALLLEQAIDRIGRAEERGVEEELLGVERLNRFVAAEGESPRCIALDGYLKLHNGLLFKVYIPIQHKNHSQEER